MANNHHILFDPAHKRHRPYVEQLAQMSNSCIFMGERGNGYPYLSPKLTDLFGLEIPEGSYSPEGSFLFDCIHPDDRVIFERVMDRLDAYIDTLPQSQRKDYKHIFEFRGRSCNGEWLRVISQHQVLDFGAQRQPILLGTLDVSPDQNPDTGFRFTLLNYKTGRVVPFDIHQGSELPLTPRETEVLELIHRGMYSKEISEQLCISIHTVNRHRQNILEKMQVDNVHEAIRSARRWGLLA